MSTQAKIDLDTIRRAHADHDAELLTSLYADDAESVTVDANNPPSSPKVLRGKDKIGDLWNDVMSRDMEHDVQYVVEGSDSVAYQVACRYPDGTRVLSSGVLELENGKIARETIVQAWDG
jgi:SnoaL-like protein